jgi:hypothetical protein
MLSWMQLSLKNTMREREISTTKFGKEKVKGKVVPSHEDMGE